MEIYGAQLVAVALTAASALAAIVTGLVYNEFKKEEQEKAAQKQIKEELNRIYMDIRSL